MKKVISTLLLVTMLLALFSGCGGKGKNQDSNDTPVVNNGSSGGNNGGSNGGNSNPSGGNTKPVAGTELSTFMSNYMDTKSKIWDEMSKKFESDNNLAFAMSSLGFAFADLAIVEISFFDAFTTLEGDIFKGTMMFSGIEGWKKVKGDIIEFGYDYKYPEDKNQSIKDDRQVAVGKFDKKTNSLYYERYTERGGAKIDRYIVEVTQNSDKSYSCQMLDVGTDKENKVITGYFTWFENQNIISIIAEKDNANFDFAYDSIFGKKNVKPEDMAKNMKINIKTSYIDGKAEFQEVNN